MTQQQEFASLLRGMTDEQFDRFLDMIEDDIRALNEAA